MINRKKGPEIHPVQKLNIPVIDQYTLTNGVKVCEINLGSQEIVKIEVVHTAGRSYEDHHLIGRATSSLLKDGCGSLNSAQIAEKIDYYGSSIKTASNMDFSFTSIHTLNKHCDRILPLLHDMYTTPTFPEDEIEKFKSLNIQKLKEELTHTVAIDVNDEQSINHLPLTDTDVAVVVPLGRIWALQFQQPHCLKNTSKAGSFPALSTKFTPQCWKPWHRGMPRNMSFGPFSEALDDDDRRAIRRVLLERLGEFREQREAVKAEFETLLTTLRAEPFDPAAMTTALAAIETRNAERLELGRSLIETRLIEMSAEERRAFADRLERGLHRGKKD